MCQGGKPDTGKFHSSYILVQIFQMYVQLSDARTPMPISSAFVMNVCGSTYENGCVVDGMCATAAD